MRFKFFSHSPFLVRTLLTSTLSLDKISTIDVIDMCPAILCSQKPSFLEIKVGN